MALYSRRTTWQSALCGMGIGTIVMIVWYALGWNKYMYEILPGFVANWLTIIILNRFIKQRNEEILKEFDEVIAEVKAGK
jgi:sodium/proline symporter